METSCPGCSTRQVVVPPAGRGRWVAICTHCGEPWAPPPETASSASPRCRAHPERVAELFCDACGAPFCKRCGEPPAATPRRKPTSPCCRALWLPRARTRWLRPFWQEPAALFAYPVQREGRFVIAFLMLLEYVPVLSFLQPFLLVTYAAHVLRVSGRDPGQAPGFPEFDSLVGDVLLPLVRLAAALFVAFSPWLLYRTVTLVDLRAPAWNVPLLALGVMVLPATVLLVSIGRSLGALLELAAAVRIVRAIWPDYFASAAALVVLALAGWGLSFAEAWSIPLAMVARGVAIYLFVLAFHLLGRMVYQTRDRVGWEP